MSATFLYNTLQQNASDIFYKAPIENKNGGQTSYAQRNKDDRDFVYIQLATKDDTPRLRCPFGISAPFDKTKVADPRKTLDIAYKNDALEKAMTGLEWQAVDFIHKNCVKWFGREWDIEKVKANFVSVIRKPENAKYWSTIRTKLNVSGTFECRVKLFLPDGRYQPGTIDDIVSGSEIIPIVRIAGLWFSSGKFGLTLECSDILVCNKAERPVFAFE